KLSKFSLMKQRAEIGFNLLVDDRAVHRRVVYRQFVDGEVVNDRKYLSGKPTYRDLRSLSANGQTGRGVRTTIRRVLSGTAESYLSKRCNIRCRSLPSSRFRKCPRPKKGRTGERRFSTLFRARFNRESSPNNPMA